MIIAASGREIDVSKPDKVMFGDSGMTKSDLALYYQRIGETMLPHVRDRAATMHRFPDGIAEEGFFQKDAPSHFPDWIQRKSLLKEDGEVDYVVINDVATLVYLADQGCITPHVTLSRVDQPHRPDRMVFDMDPPPDGGVPPLREGVRLVRSLLDELGLASYLMTSGSEGYHILVRLDRSVDFEESRDFAHELSRLAARRHPTELTVEQRKAKREGRVFVDYLRNSYGQTTVAPYAVRALPKGPVAAPIDWDELSSVEPQSYNMGNIFRRLAQKDDPWSGLSEANGQSISERRISIADLGS